MDLRSPLHMPKFKFLSLRIVDICQISICIPILFTVIVPLYRAIDGFSVSHTFRVTGHRNLRLYDLSLSMCDRKCRCYDGCTHINYHRRRLVCELISGPILRHEDIAGYVTGRTSISELTEVYQNDCAIVETVKACPEVIPGQHMAVLGNMNVVGAKRVVMCNDMYVIDGANVTTCTETGVWSEHGGCVRISTMRASCLTDAGCVDDQSECRDDQCWCKPQLSHDPATASCVPFCPGGYGTTFQSLIGFRVVGSNLVDRTVNSLEECMDFCVSYVSQGFVCKYVDYNTDILGCWLNELPDGTLPPLDPYSIHIFLQRDCAD